MKRHENVGRNILAKMVQRGVTPTEMANQMDISLSTFYRRMRRPEELTLQNLDSASSFLKVPIESLIMKGV